MQLTILSRIILCLIILASNYGRAEALIDQNFLKNSENKYYPTDDDLKSSAIDEGLIPSNADENYIQEEIKNKNTITFWIAVDRENKISMVNGLKRMFNEQSGVIIRKSAAYYVDEINAILWNSIQNGDIKDTGIKGLGYIFKTIAIMDGDFDNGEDKVKLIKEYVGEDYLEQYKKENPDKYDELIERRQEAINKLEAK